jgi:(R,R)-butanediol dehydrogenase/meso-butanediol dehydrogenase/diacetyl reductase
MPTMKAAIYHGLEDIRVQEVERQPPPPGYVLLRTTQVGICGSDLHNYFGHWPPSHSLAAGHETTGVIAEIGEGVQGFAVGDRVAVECFSHCGQCLYCQTGQYTHCLNRKAVAHGGHGGFAEYSTAHASALFKLPPEMSFEQGALVEPLAVAVRALAQSGMTYQDRVLVIGGGTIGLLCLAVAVANGARETMITVKYGQQAQIARDLGADHVIDITKEDVRAKVKALTGGQGVDVVIETVGAAGQFDDALSIVRPRGRVVLVGGYYKPLEVDLSRIVWSEAIVTGSNCYGYSGRETDFQAAIDLIASGKVDAGRIVTHRFPFQQIREAFAVAADKQSGAVKVHVLME